MRTSQNHLLALATLLLLGTGAARSQAPTDNPAAPYKLAWTEQLNWKQVVDIQDVPGASLDERLEQAQRRLGGKGGVVFFPAGVYAFRDHIKLKDGVVLRGAAPRGATDARRDGYDPPTRFEFPRYVPKLDGEGTPTATAFKGITLEDPGTASNCGVVHIAINRGHIAFGDGEGHRAGRNRLVLGCVLRNAAVAAADVPSATLGQHAWQRFTARHHPAIGVRVAENALIANNRLPPSGDDNFLQKGYVVQGRKREKLAVDEGVLFDYDNRPGIYANDYGIGPGGGAGVAGTPESHPHGFRKGVVIRDNYLYHTGRCAISFTGDGTVCAGNVIRFKPGVGRWTVTGLSNVTGSGTNDNRAVQMRGYRWVVEDNDYEVHSNIALPSRYRINDGEGLMHEAHVNSAIKGSRLVNNKGNAYLSIYRVHGIDGLLVRGNDVRVGKGIEAIFVVSGFHQQDFPCRGVTIEGNTTAGSGIRVAGRPAADNVVRGNRHVGPGGVIVNQADARLEDNTGYTVQAK